ncbi:MAG: UDP-3-O-(3-hydroxymyristoyl)glucosamine N-acyltransferase [Planctomycetota bacterium]
MFTRTVSEIAALCGASLEGDGSKVIVGPAALDEAGPDEISFLASARYSGALERTRAAAVLVAPEVATGRRELALLRCADPSRAFSRVIEEFRPREVRPAPGVHATAVVARTARIGAGAAIGAQCVVGEGARIAEGVVLHPGVVVGPDARIGRDTVVHASTVVYWGVEVGERCVLHAGVVLGSDGFGFEPTAEGWRKIPQCGTVVIEDDVEIGANTAIDRARFGATRIRRGAKIDNLVHVAHNVDVGEGSLLIAQVGVAGSARIGRGVILAGQVGVNGHVRVGDGARVAGQSGVTKDLGGHGDYSGTPIRPRMQALRAQAAAQRLPALLERVRRLEARLAALEGER